MGKTPPPQPLRKRGLNENLNLNNGLTFAMLDLLISQSLNSILNLQNS